MRRLRIDNRSRLYCNIGAEPIGAPVRTRIARDCDIHAAWVDITKIDFPAMAGAG
jgi:hypothetical protein